MKFEETKRLDDITAANLWESYAESQLPPVETTGEFLRLQLRTAFLCGGWVLFGLEQRLRRETQDRREALLDRLTAEFEQALHQIEGEARN